MLLDVERVAPCMPGATVDSVDGDVIKGRIKVKVGPVAMTYAGTARFTERDEQARSITLEASGKETRGAGTASATVRSSLADEGGQTKVVVHTIHERHRPPPSSAVASWPRWAAGSSRGSPPTWPRCWPARRQRPSVAASNGSGPGADASGPGAAAGSADGAAGPASIEELQLPVRAYNSLRRVGIHTVDDLSARTEADLLAIENLGPQSVREIKERLASIGRHLADRRRTRRPPPRRRADGAAADGAAPTAPPRQRPRRARHGTAWRPRHGPPGRRTRTPSTCSAWPASRC